MSDNDYYALLGIDADAGTDDIRAAYREKKQALTEKGDRGAVAQLNKAWNVLSDPYQRGRYDAQRESGDGATDGDDITVEDAPPPRRRGLFAPPDRGNVPVRPAPVAPAGLTFPPSSRRWRAMVIDLLVIFSLFFGSFFVTSAVLNANHKDDVDKQENLADDINSLRDTFNKFDDRADKADSAYKDLVDKPGSRDEIAAAKEKRDSTRAQADAQQKKVDAKQEEYDDVDKKLQPTRFAIQVAAFVLAFLYLVVPSAISGRTLGKRLMKLRVVRTDGSKLGWSAAITRYGLIAFPTFILAETALAPFAVAIALIVVLGWMRNPNMQALQDRAAKTLVVEA